MANKISNSIVLSGHSKVSRTRHMLALVNFIAVLLGTAITLFFLTKRGCSNGMLVIMYGILVLNVCQVALCIVDFVLKWTKGVYIKWLPFVSYGLAVLWVVAVLGEMIAGTSELGELRTDLLIVLAVQLVVAFVAYVVWPMLDRRAIGAMTAKKIRDNEAAKEKKAKGYVIKYSVICVAIVLLQVCALLIYKLPPTLYDLFDESRAIKYVSNEAGDGYIVQDVYRGTSSYLNIPAEYNGKPVVGIAEGAIDQTEIIDKYKIDEIVFGTVTVDESGNEVLVSNLQYIESGAIVNDRITSISLPKSVGFIGPSAISSTSLQTVTYESRADFDISAFSTPALTTIVMQGDSVGKIASLSGMASSVSIEVDKDIYNEYREANIEYEENFSPILPGEEFYVDFFTGCDYYLDSLFCTKGDEILLTVDDLISQKLGGIGLRTDTVAYIKNNKEMNTSGVKEKAAFRGWYYDPEFTTPCEFTLEGAVELRGNTKLYAKWVEEFYGNLNWGHEPEGVATRLTWTEEDVYPLPNYLDRAGYDAGVTWTVAGGNQQVTDTAGLGDVDFTATWHLDAPNIDINYRLVGGNEDDLYDSADGNTLQFTYDENYRLRLEAAAKHDLAESGGGNVTYDYSWSNGGEAFDIHDYVQLQNVAQSGTYTLTVTAHAEDGEISTASTDISVTIDKKNLDLGDAKLNIGEVEYNGGVQKLECVNVDTIVSQNVNYTYRYFDYTGGVKGEEVTVNGGVKDAGTYLVEVLWEKSNPDEAANYNTKTLSNQFVIKQKAISGDTWSADTFDYDSNQKTVTLAMKGRCGSDDVRFVYTNNAKTNAGEYIATVSGLEGNASKNYYLAESTTTSHEWKINQHEVTIARWELNGNAVADNAAASTVYSGITHKVAAIMSTVYGSDVVNFVYSGTVSANNVSTYNAVVTGVDNANYFFNAGAANAEREWSITKKQLTVTFTGKTAPFYNSEEQGLIATVEGFVDGEAQGFGADAFTYTGSSMAGVKVGATATAMNLTFSATNAGTYDVAIDSTSLANYSIGNIVGPTSFTIKKAELSFSLVGENTNDIYATYNGEKQYGTWTVGGFYSSDLNGISMDDFTVNRDGIQTKDVDGNVSGGLYQIKVALSDGVTNAGSYEIEFGGFTHDNYEIGIGEQITTLNVDKKTVSPRWYITEELEGGSTAALTSNACKTYNGATHGYTVSAEASGLVGEDTVTLTISGDERKAHVGSYTTTVSLVEHTNYKMDPASIGWHIDQKEISLVWKLDGREVNDYTATITYNGESHPIPASVRGTDRCEGDGVIHVVHETSYGAKDAGEHIIIAASLSNSNYKIKDGTNTFTLTINPATLTLSNDWVISQAGLDEEAYSTPTYNGKVYTVTTSVASGLFGSDKISLSYEGNTATDAGSYKATVTGIGNTNYVLDKAAYTFDWNIDKKVINNITVTGDSEFTYNNTAHEYKPTITSADVVEGDDAVFGISGNTATNAGGYVATLTVGNKNYTLGTGVDNLLEWTINTCWVNSHKFTTTKLTYNGASQHPIFSSTMCGIELAAAEYELYDESGKKIAEAVNAGTYEIKITALDNPNFHMTIGGITADFTIAKKNITSDMLNWSAQSFIYNGQEQSPTAACTFNNDTLSWDKFTKTLPENPISVGSYTVSVTGVNDDNYNISYALSYTYTIEQRQITSLAWEGDVFTYNGSEHHPTAHYMYNGQRINVTTMTFGEKSPINAGSYTATATGVDSGNFVLSGDLTHKFTINPLTIDSITWEGGTYQYDGAEHYPTAYFNYGDQRIDVTAYDKGNTKNVGTYTVTATGVDNSNFVLAKGLTKEYSITPYSIKGGEITWSTDSFVYNGRVQYPTASFSFAGDTVQFTMGAATSKNAGSYSVTLTGVNGDSNYTLDGTVTKNYGIEPYGITASDLVWTAKQYTYNGAQQMPTASCVYNNETLGWDKFSKTAPSNPTNVGEHTVTVTGISDSNYTIASAISYTYKIDPYQITMLSWEGDEFEYDGTQKSPYAYFYFNAQPTGIRVNVSNITYNATPINVGNYTATATAVDNSNFVLSGGLTHSFKVTPRIISELTWSNDEFVFDGSEHYPSAYFTYGGEDISVSTYDKKTAKDAGTYTITATGVANSNFALSSGLTHTYQITPHIITGGIAWSSNSFVYNGSIRFPDASYVYNGITVEIATDVATSINVGDYSIVARSVRNNNNFVLSTTFTYEYSITPYTITADMIKWDTETFEYTYNGEVQRPKASFSFNGVSVEFTTMDGNTDSKDARRDYKITLNGVNGNSNFIIGGTGTISKDYSIQAYTLKASDVKWSASEYVYNGKAQRPTASITIFGESISVTGYNGEETVNAGEYTVTLTVIDSTNVKLPDGGISHSYTIKAKGITSVNWLHFGFNYNGTEQPMTADYVDPELGGHVSFIISIDKTPIDVGTYTATVIGVDGNTNYEVVGSIQTEYQIFAKRIEYLQFEDYNEQTGEFTFSCEDFVSGDDVTVECKLYKDGQEWNGSIWEVGYYEVKFVSFSGADAGNYRYVGEEVLAKEIIEPENGEDNQ